MGDLIGMNGVHIVFPSQRAKVKCGRCGEWSHDCKCLDPAETVVFEALRSLDCATGAVDPTDPEDCASVATEAVRALRAAGML